MTETLLAKRELLGYPGATIELHVEDEVNSVIILDPSGIIKWGPTQSRAIARDWYFHPFVFGYDYKAGT
jgi:hypothetical protein